jgi:hypothetical protein
LRTGAPTAATTAGTTRVHVRLQAWAVIYHGPRGATGKKNSVRAPWRRPKATCTRIRSGLPNFLRRNADRQMANKSVLDAPKGRRQARSGAHSSDQRKRPRQPEASKACWLRTRIDSCINHVARLTCTIIGVLPLVSSRRDPNIVIERTLPIARTRAARSFTTAPMAC